MTKIRVTIDGGKSFLFESDADPLAALASLEADLEAGNFVDYANGTFAIAIDKICYFEVVSES
jgi:hypothetical protein